MVTAISRTPVFAALALATGIAALASLTTFVPGSHAQQAGWRSRVAPPAPLVTTSSRVEIDGQAGVISLAVKGHQVTMIETIGLHMKRAGQ